MDATIAVSEPGVNVVLQKAIALAHAASSDTATWGPFQVGYSASVALSGGVAVLENAPANKLDLNNVNVAGSVSAFFTFDLGLILPTICIPPFQVCVDIPFIGNVCTPQFCIPWPSVHVVQVDVGVQCWRWVDTASDAPNDIVSWEIAPSVTISTYRAEARSLVALFARAPGKHLA